MYMLCTWVSGSNATNAFTGYIKCQLLQTTENNASSNRRSPLTHCTPPTPPSPFCFLPRSCSMLAGLGYNFNCTASWTRMQWTHDQTYMYMYSLTHSQTFFISLSSGRESGRRPDHGRDRERQPPRGGVGRTPVSVHKTRLGQKAEEVFSDSSGRAVLHTGRPQVHLYAASSRSEETASLSW